MTEKNSPVPLIYAGEPRARAWVSIEDLWVLKFEWHLRARPFRDAYYIVDRQTTISLARAIALGETSFSQATISGVNARQELRTIGRVRVLDRDRLNCTRENISVLTLEFEEDVETLPPQEEDDLSYLDTEASTIPSFLKGKKK